MAGWASYMLLQCLTTGARHYRRSTQALCNAKTTVGGLEQLCVMYRTSVDINSDQGTQFSDHKAQECADKNNICWYFHLPYDPTAARLMKG